MSMNENCLCVLVSTLTAKVSGVGLGLDHAGLGLPLCLPGLGLGLSGLGLPGLDNISGTIVLKLQLPPQPPTPPLLLFCSENC